MKNILVLFLVSVFVFACSTDPVGPKLGEQFDLKVGQQVTVQSAGLTIKFKAVDGDSRCPEGVMCFWAGDAKVIIVVSQNEIALSATLNQNQATYSGFSFRLVNLSPYPKIDQRINPQDYVAKLVVSKN